MIDRLLKQHVNMEILCQVSKAVRETLQMFLEAYGVHAFRDLVSSRDQ